MTSIYVIVEVSSSGKSAFSFHSTRRSASLALDGLYEFGIAKKGFFYRIEEVSFFSEADIKRWISINRSKNVR